MSGVHLHSVRLLDRYGAPIPFDRDQQTTQNLLRVVEAQNLRMHSVKQEPNVKDEVHPDDSLSNYGLVDARLDRSSASSDLSGATSRTALSSIISHPAGFHGGSQGRCFLSGILFRSTDGELVAARSLKVDDTVLSCNREPVQVKSVKLHPPGEELVVLHAGQTPAALTVTRSHRVVIQRGLLQQTIPAGHLRVGDHVYCSSNRLEQLVSVTTRPCLDEVVEVMFRPDEPVEVFFPSILSKGHGWPKTTRRSRQSASLMNDFNSIPDTENSFA